MAHGKAPPLEVQPLGSLSSSRNLLPASSSLPPPHLCFLPAELGWSEGPLTQQALQGLVFAKQAGPVEAHCLRMVTRGRRRRKGTMTYVPGGGPDSCVGLCPLYQQHPLFPCSVCALILEFSQPLCIGVRTRPAPGTQHTGPQGALSSPLTARPTWKVCTASQGVQP